jgi:hypothetical protein
MENVNLIQLAQNRDQWQALVNTTMNLWVSLKADGIIVTS